MSELEKRDDSEAAIFLRLFSWFEAALQHPTWLSYLSNAKSDFEYYEGKHYTADEESELKERGQPIIVENEIKPIIDKIEGQYVGQQTRISFRGRNYPADEELGNILSDLALYVQQQTNYEYEEKDAFKDGIKSGFGVLEADIDNSGFYPKIVIKYEDCFNVFPDPYAKAYDWSDANYIHRAKWVSIEDARVAYPGKEDMIQASVNSDPITNSIVDFKRDNYFDAKHSRIRLVETWFKEWETKKFIATQTGFEDVTNMPASDLAFMKKTNPYFHIVDKKMPVLKMGVWCIGGLLKMPVKNPHNHNMYKFIPYFVDRKKSGEPVGIIRALKDPQSEINKRRSKALHLLSTNQAVFEEGAIRQPDRTREQIARPDGLIAHERGFAFALNKNIDLADTQMTLLSESRNAIKRISGLDSGVRQEVRSNAQLQRKQSMEDIVIVPVFDNLRRTRKLVAKHIYELIKQYFNEEMVFNITDNQDSPKWVTITKDHVTRMKESEFDVIVEEMPETTTMQDEQFSKITTLLTSMPLPPQVSMSLLPIVIQMSQLKNKDEILRSLQQMQQPQPEQPKISLSMQWNELEPIEKAKMAEMMGFKDLAQWEAQSGTRPATVLRSEEGITKQQIKTQGDLQKAGISKPDTELEKAKAMQDMAMKDIQHRQQMSQSDESFGQKLKQDAWSRAMNNNGEDNNA